MTSVSTMDERATAARSWPRFGSGLLTAVLAVAVAAGVLVPRHADLQAGGGALVRVVLALVVVGLGLAVPRRTRPLGAGLVAGAASGLVLAWCALVLYLALVRV